MLFRNGLKVMQSGTRVPSRHYLGVIQLSKIVANTAEMPTSELDCQREKDIISSVLFGRALVVSEGPRWGTAKFPTTFASLLCAFPTGSCGHGLMVLALPGAALRQQAEHIEFA
jgi:hypothetical protein